MEAKSNLNYVDNHSGGNEKSNQFGKNNYILHNYDGYQLAVPGSLSACFFCNVLPNTLKDGKVQ